LYQARRDTSVPLTPLPLTPLLEQHGPDNDPEGGAELGPAPRDPGVTKIETVVREDRGKHFAHVTLIRLLLAQKLVQLPSSAEHGTLNEVTRFRADGDPGPCLPGVHDRCRTANRIELG